MLLAASALFTEGKYAEAQTDFRRYLDEQPQSPFAATAADPIAPAGRTHAMDAAPRTPMQAVCPVPARVPGRPSALSVVADDWPHKYRREQAAYPAPWVREHKFWPAVARIDNPYGDRNLVCTCPPPEAFEQ